MPNKLSLLLLLLLLLLTPNNIVILPFSQNVALSFNLSLTYVHSCNLRALMEF